MVMKYSYGTIPFCPLDESRKACRERRISDDVGDVAKDAFEFLPWRAGNKLRVSLLLQELERIGDQRDLVRPMAVDRCFADAGSPSNRFYGERAIPQLTQLVEHGL